MRVCKCGVFALVAFAVGALPARAQDAPAVEITPYIGFGTAAAPPVGVAVTFPITSALAVEADVAYRRAEAGINAFSTSAGLLWYLPNIGRARPYLAGGVGLSQYAAPVFSSAGPPTGAESRAELTVNTGGGVKIPVNPKLDLRTDARWFNSFTTGSQQFRVAQGVSFDVRKR
jgi:hypothetical protein